MSRFVRGVNLIVIVAIALLSLFSFCKVAAAAQVLIAWNQSDNPSVQGYKVYHGTQSMNYSHIVDAKANLSCLISGISTAQPHYFAVTAYTSKSESGFSEELTVHSIRSSPSENGQVVPSGVNVLKQGGSKTFKITPNPGYTTADVIIDNQSVGPISRYTFSNVDACHTIKAVFTAAPPSYTISARVKRAGLRMGTISPGGRTSVISGGGQQYTITPAVNHKIADVMVDGKSVGPVSSYGFSNVADHHKIAARFAPITYTISANAKAGGSITPSGSVRVRAGESKTLTIFPAYGHKIVDLSVDGAALGAVSSYEFSNVAANHEIEASFGSMNLSLVADAGPDQIVRSGRKVTLNASNSSAPDGISAYKWAQIHGPPVTLDDPRAPVCTFKAPAASSGILLMFRLSIADKAGATAATNCIVNVTGSDMAPSAEAPRGRNVSAYSIVNLNGSRSSDPDDGILSYRWVQTGGPPVILSNADTAQASFVAPDPGIFGLTLAFKLLVLDHFGLKMRDYCLVNVIGGNKAPVVSAGQDLTVDTMDSVTLDGSGSVDPGTVSYRWTQTRGVPVTLSNPLSPLTTFTAPFKAKGTTQLEFKLTVTNESGLSTSDKCVVNVRGMIKQ